MRCDSKDLPPVGAQLTRKEYVHKGRDGCSVAAEGAPEFVEAGRWLFQAIGTGLVCVTLSMHVRERCGQSAKKTWGGECPCHSSYLLVGGPAAKAGIVVSE